jgi:peptide/nickel transport system ATP-binding protein
MVGLRLRESRTSSCHHGRGQELPLSLSRRRARKGRARPWGCCRGTKQVTENAYDLRSVSKAFAAGMGLSRRQAEPAVRDVSFELKSGEVLGLVGESGCGKSTLMKLMLGLIPLGEGSIRCAGRPIDTISRKEIARLVQPVFQDPYSSLNPRHSVAQIISRPFDVHDVGTRSERRSEAEKLMSLVGLPKYLVDNYPSQLSGGQRQRVAIARALALKPKVLLCDEPTSALDVSVQAQILNLLMTLRAELDLTLVVVSHNLAVVEHLATRIIVMYRGSVVESGSTDEVFLHARHPYTKLLLGSVLLPFTKPDQLASMRDKQAPPQGNSPGACAFYERCGDRMDVCGRHRPALAGSLGSMVACHMYGDQRQEAPHDA